MRKTLITLFVVACQVALVWFFYGTRYKDSIQEEEYVSTVHNANLDKIATSVSLLFEDEEVDFVADNIVEDLTLEELPSIDKEEVKEEIVSESKEEIVTTPLVSVDASKYANREDMGFVVTEGNKQYDLSNEEFDVVVAVVAGEFDKNLNDALGVVSVILNRCDSDKWRRWAGETPYQQVIRKGQFEVYYAGMYLKYMPGGALYGKEKYNIAKQAVIDGLNGIRNNNYLGFRAWWITGYSDKYMVDGGNRYGYN